MNCPLCGTRVPVDGQTCPHCGTPLAEYARVVYLASWLYNRAIDQLREGRWDDACALFAQAALFESDKPDVLRGWALALAMAGRKDAALATIGRAVDIGGPAVHEDYDRIAALVKPRAAPPARRPRRRSAPWPRPRKAL